MRIATWNVNSVRSRLEQVQRWLVSAAPNVLCLQETKVIDADFPISAFTELGYESLIYGQKSYNGVAILSRDPVTTVRYGFDQPILDEQKRLIQADIGGFSIVNVYVPNGSEVDSDKYHYKLAWLESLQHYLAPLVHQPLVLCGDFNIALDKRDMHDPKKEGQIMASTAERTALQQILSLGLTDVFRHFTEEAGHYSWWDYRSASFRRNQGWRIDHIYLSATALSTAQTCIIDVTPRHNEKPSDHTPVIVELSPAAE